MSDVLVRPSKVSQWGNSAAVRLTSAALDRAHLHMDDAVEVIARDDEIIIRRQRPKVTMSDLLARFDPAKHRHELMLDAAPVGTETGAVS
jgi:antitoxin component of MazEF toxin-antitoxin module